MYKNGGDKDYALYSAPKRDEISASGRSPERQILIKALAKEFPTTSKRVRIVGASTVEHGDITELLKQVNVETIYWKTPNLLPIRRSSANSKGDTAMKSENSLASTQKPLPQQKPDTSLVSEMLTPSEIEQLRQSKRDDNAYFQKAFAHLKKKD